jgi:hypothetical protein
MMGCHNSPTLLAGAPDAARSEMLVMTFVVARKTGGRIGRLPELT